MPEVDEPLLRPRAKGHATAAELLVVALRGDVEEAAPGVGAHLAQGCAACEERLEAARRNADALRGALADDAELAAGRVLPWREPRAKTDPAAFRARVARFSAEVREAEAQAAALVALIGKGAEAVVEEAERASALALHLAVQKASRALSRSPADGLALAEAALERAEEQPDASDAPRPRVSRQILEAEALLLKAQALTWLGQAAEAVGVVRAARPLFEEAGESGFAQGLCDYFEGSAHLFAGDAPAARKMLDRACQVFAEFGQSDWLGRGEAALGDATSSAGDLKRALPLFERALSRLDPDADAQAWTGTAVNRATTLVYLGELDAASSAYAEALGAARRHGFSAMTRRIRNGLAEIRARRGDWAGALASFDALAGDARAAGFEDDELYARLHAAECLGRLGRTAEMEQRVADVRRSAPVIPIHAQNAVAMLFRCLDERDLKADVVAEVRQLLEGVPRVTHRSQKRA